MLLSDTVSLDNSFHSNNYDEKWYKVFLSMAYDGVEELIGFINNNTITIADVEDEMLSGVQCTLDLLEVLEGEQGIVVLKEHIVNREDEEVIEILSKVSYQARQELKRIS